MASGIKMKQVKWQQMTLVLFSVERKKATCFIDNRWQIIRLQKKQMGQNGEPINRNHCAGLASASSGSSQRSPMCSEDYPMFVPLAPLLQT